MPTNQISSHHISSLSITPDGWIIASSSSDDTTKRDGANVNQPPPTVEVTASCKELLKLCQLDLSDELFTNDSQHYAESAAVVNDHANREKNQGDPSGMTQSTGDNSDNVQEVENAVKEKEEVIDKEIESADDVKNALENLPYCPELPNMLLKLMADIRRMGGPSSRDLAKELERTQSANGGDGVTKGAKSGRRGRNNERGRNKVAQLEEQRRLRLQQEQLKQQQSSQSEQFRQSERSEQSGQNEKEKDLPLDGFNNNISTQDVNADDEDFILVGDSTHNEESTSDLPPNVCLAITFNSLRVLISLLRPMLDHPNEKDYSLKMKGKNIKKNGKHFSSYLFSKHVYSCLSAGCGTDVRREYRKVLSTLDESLIQKMAEQDETSGNYKLGVKEWISSLFNHELFTNEEVVEKQCLNLVIPPNHSVSAALHNAHIDQFSYESGEMQKKLQQAIHNLQSKLYNAISRKFNGVRLTVYGSCLSGLALQGSHDVDVSVYIPVLYNLKQRFDKGLDSAQTYDKQMRKIVFQVRDSLRWFNSQCFQDLFAITRARVPVVKGRDVGAFNPYSSDGSLTFDLCFLNDIAVVNSSLLREYSLFDNRVRMLMLAVKSFAKNKKIASAADGTLSSYTWLNLVVFYLQCIGFLPALQCPVLMEQHGFQPDQEGNPWHAINGLETFYLFSDMVKSKGIWEQPSRFKHTKMPHLLYGFFNFYSNIFPQQTVAVSIRFGKCMLQKTSFRKTSKMWRLCVEDPFETFDSHCPHDLGCHLDEPGQAKVMQQLTQATITLGNILRQDSLNNHSAENFIHLIAVPNKNSKNGQLPRNPSAINQQVAPKGQQYRGTDGNHHNQKKNGGARHSNNHHNQPRQNGHNQTHQYGKGGNTHTIIVDIPDDGAHDTRGGNKNRPIHQKPKKANATLLALDQVRQKKVQSKGGDKGQHKQHSSNKTDGNASGIKDKDTSKKPPKKDDPNQGVNGDYRTSGKGNHTPNSKHNQSNKKHLHKLSRMQQDADA